MRYVAEHHAQVRQNIVAKSKIDEAFAAELKEIITAFKQKMGYAPKA